MTKTDKEVIEYWQGVSRTLALALEDAMQQEGVWYGDPEIIAPIMAELGVGDYE